MLERTTEMRENMAHREALFCAFFASRGARARENYLDGLETGQRGQGNFSSYPVWTAKYHWQANS